MKNLATNVWKINFMRAVNNFMVIMPVVVLFFQENGLSMKEVLFLQAIFSVAVLLLEIPSGYFSDRFGRKNSIIFGWSFVSLGFIGYSLAGGFWGFLFAELVLGLGCSFISGTDSALLYDTLLELGREKEYKRIEGKSFSIALISSGTASVLGGFLAIISLRVPIYCEAVITLCAFPIILSIYEPPKRRVQVAGGQIKEIMRLVKYSLRDNMKLKWAIYYSSFAATSTLVMVWFMQPYLKVNNVDVKFFGIILACLMLFSAFASWNVERIERVLGRRVIIASMLVFPVMGYFLLGSIWSMWSGVFFLLFYFARGVNGPIINDIIQNLISSEIRATILSIKNLVARLMFSILGPLIGWINDDFSLKIALLVSGAVFLLAGTTTAAFLFFNGMLVKGEAK